MKKINSLPLKGLALPFVFLVAFSCNRNPNDSDKIDVAPAAMDTTAAIPPIPGVPTPQGLLLIKEASLQVSVTNLSNTAQRLEKWLEGTGGYYTNWSQAKEVDSLRLELTARIPTENFEAFKDSVETLGILELETAGAEDKTDAYADALGKNALAQTMAGAYDRAGEKAAGTPDALTALNKEGERKEDAEAASQEAAKMRRHAAMSTVYLTATQPIPVVVTPFGQRLWDNLGIGWSAVEKIILLLATAWPLALFIGGGVFLLRVFRSRGTRGARGARTTLATATPKP